MNHTIKILLLSLFCYNGISAQSSSLTVTSSLNNTMDRPAVNAGTINGEIRGLSSAGPALDDGFLRVSAGGGTNSNTKSFIDLSGYTTATAPDRSRNITLGTSGLERMRIDFAGNVGIGTIAPKYTLHSVSNSNTGTVSSYLWGQYYGTAIGVLSNATPYYAFSVVANVNSDGTGGAGGSKSLFYVRSDGNIGIGTSTPYQKLDVIGIGVFRTDQPGQDSYLYNDPSTGFITTGKNGAASLQPLRLGVGNTEYLRIDLTGNMLVGKTSQENSSYKLDVAGNIRANKVVVNTTGADFVFDSSYQLPSLSEVEHFISANKHLPGIASAAQMQQEGLEIGEHQTKLLQKTEELTLYAIDQDKRLAEQNKKLEEQDKKISSLEKKLSEQSVLIEKLLKQLTSINSNQP